LVNFAIADNAPGYGRIKPAPIGKERRPSLCFYA
jgi:hypothetical protein